MESRSFPISNVFGRLCSKRQECICSGIDAERPKIDQALHFFQNWYNGHSKNSPNCIEYLFLPLYKKSYSEDERLKIIADHKHYIGTDSVVAMKGLQPLDNLIKLVSGVHTTIRRLLLSMPIDDTATGNLFAQVERQPVDNCLLGCFYSHNAMKVTSKLSTLEDSLCRVVPQQHWPELFADENGLTFNGQVAPLINKKHQVPRQAPPQMEEYITKSLKTLYSPTPKWNVTDMGTDHQADSEFSTPAAKVRPSVSYASATTTVFQPTQPPTSTIQTVTKPSMSVVMAVTPAPQNNTLAHSTHRQADTDISDLKETAILHSDALLALRECCTNLIDSQKQMSRDIFQMNEGFNKKFADFSARMEDMTEAISNLKHSPNRASTKFRKEHHSHPDIDIDL
jgi:hypothetical protein